MKFATINSGSSGNCIYIEGGGTSVLVDAGCTNRCLLQSLAAFGKSAEQISAILITHEHSDHISGVQRISRRFGIPVFASELTWENLPFYDDFLPWERHIFDYGMEIGALGIDFFRLSHDAVQPVGFVFGDGTGRVGVATDTGEMTPSMIRALKDCDGLVFEANHDADMLMRGPYPAFLKRRVASAQGHLSNHQAGCALLDLLGSRTRNVVLAHLSETNNRPELALREVCNLLAPCAFAANVEISVAPRFAAHTLIDLSL